MASLQQQSLLGALALDFGIQWLGWALAAALRTECFYDAVGSLSFVTLALSTLARGAAAPRALLLTALVGLWALRLGSHLVARIRVEGKDRRFDGVRDRPAKFLFFWTIQGVWVFVTSLPCLLVNTALSQPALRWTDALGLAVWLCGFSLEWTADAQKSAWRADPANQGRYIDTGLWSLARHPNYCGEIMLWLGCACIGAGGVGSAGGVAAAFASPAFVTLLLTRVSGVPMLEASARKRWGKEKGWREYQARTRTLLPLPHW